MDFSYYNDLPYSHYEDIGPKEPWYIEVIRKHEEYINKLQRKVNDLESSLSELWSKADMEHTK